MCLVLRVGFEDMVWLFCVMEVSCFDFKFKILVFFIDVKS